MKNNYCLPIQEKRKALVLHQIQKHISLYAYFEVWVDGIIDYDESFILELAKKLQGKLIINFRIKKGNRAHLNRQQRLKIILACSKTKVLIDLDIELHKKEIEYVHVHVRVPQTHLLISYHNFKLTPNNRSLVAIINMMKRYKPKVIKIATKCRSMHDSLRLIDLMLSIKKPAIVIGMGHLGRITRIMGAELGNTITFAPETLEKNSAPGQLTRKELEMINTVING